MKWQPIETAPKDGTVILLADKDSAYVGGWNIGDALIEGFPWGIIDVDGHWNAWSFLDGPTHWMPLPESPE